jgi:hypothetical protein
MRLAGSPAIDLVDDLGRDTILPLSPHLRHYSVNPLALSGLAAPFVR